MRRARRERELNRKKLKTNDDFLTVKEKLWRATGPTDQLAVEQETRRPPTRRTYKGNCPEFKKYTSHISSVVPSLKVLIMLLSLLQHVHQVVGDP